MIIDNWHRNRAAVEQAGQLALAAARKAGVAAYYIDPSLGDGIVKEMPDGTRHLIEIEDNREILIGTFGPRV